MLFAILIELYILMPLHVYVGEVARPHVVHMVQDWTLGILYVRIVARVALANEDGLPSRIINAIFFGNENDDDSDDSSAAMEARPGTPNEPTILKPHAATLTRALLLPVLLLFGFLALTPFLSASVLNATIFSAFSPEDKLYVLRMIYPFSAGCAVWTWLGMALGKATVRWRARIRDEVYLIGERLHNFGEGRKAASEAKTVKVE